MAKSNSIEQMHKAAGQIAERLFILSLPGLTRQSMLSCHGSGVL
jgi:hypothetical protein